MANVFIEFVSILMYWCSSFGGILCKPKPGRRVFVNIEEINKKYQLLMVRFIKVIHLPRYGEIEGF